MSEIQYYNGSDRCETMKYNMINSVVEAREDENVGSRGTW